jgi:MOSC domain-containing protein YiiM
MGEGRLEAIWLKRVRRGPMDPATRATVVAGRGLAGNADQGGRRQVTILVREGWEAALREVGAVVDPSRRRANLLVSGLDLERAAGALLRVGGCVVRVRGETTPCERMDEAWPGLADALRPRWRAGVFGEVIEGGEIRVGDPVVLEREAVAHSLP